MYKIVTIDSEYCSMGRWISVIAGKKLNLKLYEESDLCKEAGVEYESFKAFENNIPDMSVYELKENAYFKEVQKKFTDAVLRIVENGNCIIHEKAASYLLRDRKDVLKVMIFNANMEHKIPRCKTDTKYHTECMSHDELVSFIKREDRKRSLYYEAVTGEIWGDRNQYGLLLDSDVLSREKCAEVLIEACSDVKIDSGEAASLITQAFPVADGVSIKNLG